MINQLIVITIFYQILLNHHQAKNAHHINDENQRYFFWGSPKILVECVVLWDPENWCFIAFLSDNFWGVLFYGTKFLSKNRPKIRKIFENFFKKKHVFCFKMVLNGRILMNFDKIAHKTPHKLFLETFQNFENFWEFDPQNPPKFTFYCSSKWQFSEKLQKFSKTAPSAPFSGASRPKILAEYVVLWVKKIPFCAVGTPPIPLMKTYRSQPQAYQMHALC